MFVVQNLIKEYQCGCLVGHPYIASLWLGFSICEAFTPKRVLRRRLALFCLLPGYFQAFDNLVNQRVQRSLCYLRAHSRVWRGSMLYKAFCLVYHGSHSNNREHIHSFWKLQKIFDMPNTKFFNICTGICLSMTFWEWNLLTFLYITIWHFTVFPKF